MKVERYNKLSVKISSDRCKMGMAAAKQVAKKICEIINEKGKVRVIFAGAPSQLEFLQALAQEECIDWSKVIAFNQDEYLGVSLEERHSIGKYLKDNLYDKVKPGTVHFINGAADNIELEIHRYSKLLTECDNDIICLGVGENGHIAFNEPDEADFNDPNDIKIITLDEKCRVQQFHDFGFSTIDDVPKQGITITIPIIMKTKHIYCIVPSQRKAEIVRKMLLGPVSEECPASILRLHDSAFLFLDRESSKLLSENQ